MSKRDLPVSEYDKFGDFCYNKVQEGDPAKEQTVVAILSMLGDVADVKICDLACGEGFFSRLLAARGAQVTGIDLSANLLAHARRQSTEMPIRYLLDDAQQLTSVPDGSFDIVICNMALMDIEDLTATFHTVNRISAGGGLFFFGILHPCFVTPFNTKDPQIEQDAEGNFVAKRVSQYSQEGKWYSDGTGFCGTLGSIHRKLSTYLNELAQAGFSIQEVSEPLLPPGSYQTAKEQWRSTVPAFLVVQSRKVA
ncbi:MAG: methyltransferase domain-containing protein [Candidatus Latescibacteria bacterium]|nr:methyltransferase domain-containing protein [Candidatus Latescibacterota bacterium]